MFNFVMENEQVPAAIDIIKSELVSEHFSVIWHSNALGHNSRVKSAHKCWLY